MIMAPAFLKQLQNPQFEIKPITLIYGEEPLYVRRALDGLRGVLRSQEYFQRDRYEVDANFKWADLKMETQAGTLFADRRIIELDMPKGTPGKDGGAFIQDWANAMHDQPPEICLVITCEKLDGRQLKSKWVQAIEAHGWVVQSKPIEGAGLIKWCQNRAQEAGLSLDEEAAGLLSERVEGNLLAADQEMEKLALLFPAGSTLSAQNIIDNVADQAHYQLFALSTAMLFGRTQYALQILHRLQQEGLEAPIVLWLLSKELRQLISIAQKQQMASLPQVYKQLRIWSSKQAEFSAALQRHDLAYWQSLLNVALQVDLTIKGLRKGDEWLGLSELVFKISQ
ncbi:DNA polymerase III subunit delta [Hydrogenovibrio crunogenus]|uniref:DNA polymerase III subunit delta n=1 Tax=Hydrogenovibrio crunogenus TaxID=39765 RepID=A0A4P7NXJ1_9GAMM|nr:DNA polymerase III subunit delta [Hydrogenovibrio crunogenus]QBZ82481.1 DNA polymerase III subunit delta [Hydrogenovibrio crunogenus]RUM92764.1 MAG: DNA polymerase III subunit delta [Thiomicrospira sp.]